MKNCSKEQKRIKMPNNKNISVENLEIDRALSWLSAKKETEAFKAPFFELLSRNSKTKALQKDGEIIGVSIEGNRQKKAFILPKHKEEVKNVIDNR